jgi:hypothetical protein
MRMFCTILGGMLFAAGMFWILIGNGILRLGFMTSDMQWAWRGASAVSAGVTLLYFVLRKEV